jgi:glucose dehydrogenase
LLPLLLSAFLTLRVAAQRTGGADPTLDWPQFGYDAASPSASPARTGIDTANIASLSHRQASLGGTADASAIYLHSVKIAGSFHDKFFVTTSYGTTIAIDADTGRHQDFPGR